MTEQYKNSNQQQSATYTTTHRTTSKRVSANQASASQAATPTRWDPIARLWHLLRLGITGLLLLGVLAALAWPFLWRNVQSRQLPDQRTGTGSVTTTQFGPSTGGLASSLSSESSDATTLNPSVNSLMPLVGLPKTGIMLTQSLLNFHGYGAPSTRIQVMVDGREVDSVPVNDDGEWSVAVNVGESGTHHLQMMTLNERGDVIAASESVELLVADTNFVTEWIAISSGEIDPNSTQQGEPVNPSTWVDQTGAQPNTTLIELGQPGASAPGQPIQVTQRNGSDDVTFLIVPAANGSNQVQISAVDKNGRTIATSEPIAVTNLSQEILNLSNITINGAGIETDTTQTARTQVARTQVARTQIEDRQQTDVGTNSVIPVIVTPVPTPMIAGTQASVAQGGGVGALGTESINPEQNSDSDTGNLVITRETYKGTICISPDAATIAAKNPNASIPFSPVTARTGGTGVDGCPCSEGVDLGDSYILASCETLYSVSVDLGINYGEMLMANAHLGDPNLVQPGEVINLPPR